MILIPKSPLTGAWGWTIFILLLLSIPGGAMPSTTLFQLDKLVHVFIFFILAILWLKTPWNSSTKRSWIILVAGLAFSILSELYQGIIPIDRTPDVLDAVADSIGFITGAAVWFLIKSTRRN